jgi:multiple sugar transport system substrate-binding protein
MNKWLRYGILAVSLMLFLVLSGCAKANKKDASQKPVEVTLWVMPNSLEPVNDLAKVLEGFYKEHPNIKVKITSLDWGAAWVRITTAAVSGDAPDIVQLGTTWVAAISSMGALSDLTPQVNAMGGASVFLPSIWKTSSIEGSDKVTAIPWFVDARAMYYRTDVFNKLGLTKADLSTWAGFHAALDKIKKADLTIDGKKISPLGIPGKNDWNVVHNLAPWIWNAGGDFLAADYKKSSLNTPETAEGLAYYISLVTKGYVARACLEKNTAQIENDFNNGTFAVIFDGSNELRGLTTSPEQGGAADTYVAKRFDIAPYPAGPKGKSTFVGGSNLAIFKGSKNKEAAWEVLKYLSSKEAQVEYCKRSGFMPAVVEAFDDPYFTEDSRRAVYKETVKDGRAYPSVPSWGLIEPILARRFGIMWDYVLEAKSGFGVAEIQKLLSLADKEVVSILEKNK